MPNTAPEGAARPVIPVACGVLVDARGQVLIAQRPAGKIAAGKWEFPGGKIEPGESAAQALARELEEELSVRVRRARPLVCVRHDYSDRTVVLDTWLVTEFDGPVQSREGQAFAWTPVERLGEWDLLAADGPILDALRLPSHYVFTPPDAEPSALLAALPRLPRGALLRLRRPGLGDAAYAELAATLLPACRDQGLKLILDRAPEQAAALGAAGWHARESVLRGLGARPLPPELVFAASAHGTEALARARACGADCAVLGPVLPTATHPDAVPLGWSRFAQWVRGCGLPVYAIGGLGPAQLEQAYAAGAQGVAAIRAYYGSEGRFAGGSAGASSSRTGSA